MAITKVTDNVITDGAVTDTKLANAKQNVKEPHSATAQTFTVTVAAKTSAHRYNGSGSSSGYVIDGVQSPYINITPGNTYKFDQSDSSNSGHPLAFYYEADKTTSYSTGVTTNGTAGTSGAYTQIIATDSTPTVLHYQCTAHSLMGNTVNFDTAFTVDDDSITHDKLENRYTAQASITTLTGTVSFNCSTASSFKLSGNLTGAYTINLSNYKKGQVITIYPLQAQSLTLAAQGSSTNTFNKIGGDYDNSTSNVLQIECVDDSSTDPVFFYSIVAFTSDATP